MRHFTLFLKLPGAYYKIYIDQELKLPVLISLCDCKCKPL